MLPLRCLEFNSQKLFCHECGKRVFGLELDRAPIAALDCRGVVHRVRFVDDVVFDFAPGHSERVSDEQEATTPCED